MAFSFFGGGRTDGRTDSGLLMSRTCGHVPLHVSMQTEHLKVTDVCVSGQLVEYIFLIILRACVFVCKVYSVDFLIFRFLHPVGKR